MKMSEVKYLFLWGVRKAKVTILCTLYFFKITISNFISKKKMTMVKMVKSSRLVRRWLFLGKNVSPGTHH